MPERLYKMSLHQTVEIDGEEYKKVPGGWIYNDNIFIPYSNEYKPKSEGSNEKIKTQLKEETTRLISYWNSKKIAECKKQTFEIEKAYFNRCKKNTKQEIKEAIDNYNIIIKDKDYFFDTKWSLIKFLKQGNTVDDFHNEGSKWLSYKDKKQGTIKGESVSTNTSRIADKLRQKYNG